MMNVHAISRNARIHLFLLVSSLLLIIVPMMNKTPTRQIAEKSVMAAAEFLFLVDTEEYAKSWEVSSQVLKDMLSKERWQKQITKIRSYLGPIVERIHHDITYTDSASDVPSGEYVVMTFISKFEFREKVTETITLLLGENKQWEVVGYFLK